MPRLGRCQIGAGKGKVGGAAGGGAAGGGAAGGGAAGGGAAGGRREVVGGIRGRDRKRIGARKESG